MWLLVVSPSLEGARVVEPLVDTRQDASGFVRLTSATPLVLAPMHHRGVAGHEDTVRGCLGVMGPHNHAMGPVALFPGDQAGTVTCGVELCCGAQQWPCDVEHCQSCSCASK